MLDIHASTEALNRIATALEAISGHLQRIANPPLDTKPDPEPFGPEYFSQITNSSTRRAEIKDWIAQQGYGPAYEQELLDMAAQAKSHLDPAGGPHAPHD